MRKFLKNNKGASLIEIIATITITSIALIMIYNIFSYNINHNKVNREQTINANIAYGILNYFSSQDYPIFQSHLGDNEYVKIDVNTCEEIFLNENEITNCKVILSPLINNKQYTSDNLYVYLLPYYGPQELKNINKKNSEDILTYIKNIDSSNYSFTNDNTLMIIVVVESSLNKRYDYILGGVITKW